MMHLALAVVVCNILNNLFVLFDLSLRECISSHVLPYTARASQDKGKDY